MLMHHQGKPNSQISSEIVGSQHSQCQWLWDIPLEWTFIVLNGSCCGRYRTRVAVTEHRIFKTSFNTCIITQNQEEHHISIVAQTRKNKHWIQNRASPFWQPLNLLQHLEKGKVGGYDRWLQFAKSPVTQPNRPSLSTYWSFKHRCGYVNIWIGQYFAEKCCLVQVRN